MRDCFTVQPSCRHVQRKSTRPATPSEVAAQLAGSRAHFLCDPEPKPSRVSAALGLDRPTPLSKSDLAYEPSIQRSAVIDVAWPRPGGGDTRLKTTVRSLGQSRSDVRGQA